MKEHVIGLKTQLMIKDKYITVGKKRARATYEILEKGEMLLSIKEPLEPETSELKWMHLFGVGNDSEDEPEEAPIESRVRDSHEFAGWCT